TAAEQYYMQSGSGTGLVCAGYGGCFYETVTGGEPSSVYIDTVFGNGNGIAEEREWDRWAHSLQGRFHSLDEAYEYFRTKTFTYTVGGVGNKVAAYPGFSGCRPGEFDRPHQCLGIYDFYGFSSSRQVPRTVRLGVKLTF